VIPEEGRKKVSERRGKARERRLLTETGVEVVKERPETRLPLKLRCQRSVDRENRRNNHGEGRNNVHVPMKGRPGDRRERLLLRQDLADVVVAGVGSVVDRRRVSLVRRVSALLIVARVESFSEVRMAHAQGRTIVEDRRTGSGGGKGSLHGRGEGGGSHREGKDERVFRGVAGVVESNEAEGNGGKETG
jgi:hypothetical protein